MSLCLLFFAFLFVQQSEPTEEQIIERLQSALLISNLNQVVESDFVLESIGVVEDQGSQLKVLIESHRRQSDLLEKRRNRESFEQSDRIQEEAADRYEIEIGGLLAETRAKIDEVLLPHQQKKLANIVVQRFHQIQLGYHSFDVIRFVLPIDGKKIDEIENREFRELSLAIDQEREVYSEAVNRLVAELVEGALNDLDPEVRARVVKEFEEAILYTEMANSFSLHQYDEQWVDDDKSEKRSRGSNRVGSKGLESWADENEFEEPVQRRQSLDVTFAELILRGINERKSYVITRLPDLTEEQGFELQSRMESLLGESDRRNLAVRPQWDRVSQLRAMGLEDEAERLSEELSEAEDSWRAPRINAILNEVLLPHQADRIRLFSRQLRAQVSLEYWDPLSLLIAILSESDLPAKQREQIAGALELQRKAFFDRAIELRKSAIDRITRSMSRALRDRYDLMVGEPYDYYEELRAELE